LYKNASYNYALATHPESSNNSALVWEIAEHQWREASMAFLVETINTIKFARPLAKGYGYYGYPTYWGGGGYWGGGMYPGMLLPGYGGFGGPQAIREETQHARARVEQARDPHADPHLRSCKAITGYHIHASDGEIGHVSGMLIDDETWAVRYLIVDTSNWWVGHEMLVAPQWIEGVSWAEDTVSVKLTRQAVKDAPAFDPTGPLTREDEARLHEHYGRSGYWAAEDKSVTEATHV
jgi:hypothetical protein